MSKKCFITLGDVAEGFGTQDDDLIEGTVVVLNQHGLARPGDEAYDKKVAGVGSGAGDFRPAIVLVKQHPRVGQLPVALMGKSMLQSGCSVFTDRGRRFAYHIGDARTCNEGSRSFQGF